MANNVGQVEPLIGLSLDISTHVLNQLWFSFQSGQRSGALCGQIKALPCYE